jgi:trehalose synthase-fused probable maltokinase
VSAALSERELVERLRGARWFGGKDRALRSLRVVDHAEWTDTDTLSLVEVQYQYGRPETYVVTERFPEPAVARTLLRQLHGAHVPTAAGGELVFCPTHLLGSVPAERTEPVAAMSAEQSNTSVRFGDALILKLFRRLQFGPNPDVEIGRFLTERTTFGGTPAVVGSVDYVAPDGQMASLVLLQRFEHNRGDAWTTTLRRLSAVLDGAELGESIQAMQRLGRTTAELHVALAGGSEAEFVPEVIDEPDLALWREAILTELDLAVSALARRAVQTDAISLAHRADGIRTLGGAEKIRHHGDYHLGQVLERPDGGFVIIDFEGEPAKPLAQRREKRSPLRDVAGMLRSLDYARNAALRDGNATDAARRARADHWYTAVRGTFLDAYFDVVAQHAPRLLPADPHPALAALELEKAAYEVLYELNNRPDWLPIPLAALTAS